MDTYPTLGRKILGGYVSFLEGTPLKINMEPEKKKQPFEKENNVFQTFILGVPSVHFQGCIYKPPLVG